MYPFIYALMNKKLFESYKHLFKYIEENVFELKPVSFITDYELAMRKALKETYPNAAFKNCWFHYTQCLKRKVAQMPVLSSKIKSDKKTGLIYRKFLSLPLLNAIDIENAFIFLKNECENEKFILNGHSLFFDFIKYFENQWLKKVDIKYIYLKIIK